MGVKFTPNFKQSDIRNFIRNQVSKLDRIILRQIQDVAEEFVREARSNNKANTKNWVDQSRNLRGSIGYVILKDGEEIFGDFDGTAEGQSEARKLSEGIVADYPRGYALIVVAGMNYALFVEANGFDVLTGSSQTAAGNLKKSIEKIKKGLSKVK